MTNEYNPMDRVDNQINWYDRKSVQCQRKYKVLKVIELISAASVPLAAGTLANAYLTGGLGVLVVILEGLQQLGQHQHCWITYRSTCEALKHEKYLYLGHSGPYARARDPRSLLVERTESLISTEHAKWASTQQEAEHSTDAGKAPE